MNRRMVIFFLGWVMRIEASLMILPIICSAIYREKETLILFAIALATFLLGYLLSARKPKNATLYTREGFVAVALSWVLLSIIGALPFYITKAIPSFSDALFDPSDGWWRQYSSYEGRKPGTVCRKACTKG